MVDWGFEAAPKTAKFGGQTVAALNLPTPHSLPQTATCRQAVEFLQAHKARYLNSFFHLFGCLLMVPDCTVWCQSQMLIRDLLA